MKLSEVIGFEGFEKARDYFCNPSNPYESLTQSQVCFLKYTHIYPVFFKFLKCFQEVLADKYPGDSIVDSFFQQIDANNTGSSITSFYYCSLIILILVI